jgi:hypothetical protein
MRHHRLPLLAGVVALGFGLAIVGCEASTSVGSYYITYRTSVLTGIATIDSVLYSPGTGKCIASCNADSSMVLVKAPALSVLGNWEQELTLPAGSTLQATLYGSGTATGTAQFTVIWMTATGVIRGDSLQASTAAATKFSVAIPKMSL